MTIDCDYQGSGKTEAQYWADEAVRHGRIAFRLQFIATILMVAAVVVAVIAMVL